MQNVDYLASPGDYGRIQRHRHAIGAVMVNIIRYARCKTPTERDEIARELAERGLKTDNLGNKDVILAHDKPICIFRPVTENGNIAPIDDPSTVTLTDDLEKELMRFMNVSDWTNPMAVEILLSESNGKSLATYANTIAWVIELQALGINENEVEKKYPSFYIDRFTLRKLTQQRLVGLKLEQQIKALETILQSPSGIEARKGDKITFIRDRIMHEDEVLNPEAKKPQLVTMRKSGKIEINRALPAAALIGLAGARVEDVIEGPLFKHTDIVIKSADVERHGGVEVSVLQTDVNDHNKLMEVRRY